MATSWSKFIRLMQSHWCFCNSTNQYPLTGILTLNMIFISDSISISANDVSKIFAADTTHKRSTRANELRVYIKCLSVSLSVCALCSMHFQANIQCFKCILPLFINHKFTTQITTFTSKMRIAPISISDSASNENAKKSKNLKMKEQLF